MWKSAQIGVFFKEGRFLSTQTALECGRWNSYTLSIYTVNIIIFKMLHFESSCKKNMQSSAKCNIIIWLFELNLLLQVLQYSSVFLIPSTMTQQLHAYELQGLSTRQSHQPFSAYFSDKFQANILSWKLWMRQSKNLFLIAVVTVKLYVSPYHKNLFSSSLWWKRT